MSSLIPIEPIDYLIIGHITRDLTPSGPVPGGTASYAALTATAMGLRVGIVTAGNFDDHIPELEGISIVILPADQTTTFENINTPTGRIQYIHHLAPKLNASIIPEIWLDSPIVHLAPVAGEVDPNLVRIFPKSFIGLTPQGWLRSWDGSGRVHPSEWYEANYVLEKANAAVLSIEDVQGDETRIEEMVSSIRIMVVTEAASGARLYWNGDLRHFYPPQVEEVDATGAGDIFAAAFFIRAFTTHDPWEASRFATQIAANSVTRVGLKGVPTFEEVQYHLMEIIPNV